MRSRIYLLSILVVCMTISSGCSRAIKEGYYGASGSSGHYILLEGQESQLKQLPNNYGSVEVGSISNDIGGACPPAFLIKLPNAIEEQLRFRSNDGDKGPFLRGPNSKKLLISGSVIHYDTGKLLDKIVGPMEEAICRLQIRDAKSNDLLAEANFVSRAKSSIRKGPDELAAGIGKGIKKLLEPKKE